MDVSLERSDISVLRRLNVRDERSLISRSVSLLRSLISWDNSWESCDFTNEISVNVSNDKSCISIEKI